MPTQHKYQREVKGNVLYVKLAGVWTTSLVDQVYQELPELVGPIQAQPWAALIDMQDWMMPSLDAFEAFGKIYQWCLEHNQTHEATICRFDMQKKLVSAVSEYDQEQQLITPNTGDAIQWLEAKGFEVTLPEFISTPPIK